MCRFLPCAKKEDFYILSMWHLTGINWNRTEFQETKFDFPQGKLDLPDWRKGNFQILWRRVCIQLYSHRCHLETVFNNFFFFNFSMDLKVYLTFLFLKQQLCTKNNRHSFAKSTKLRMEKQKCQECTSELSSKEIKPSSQCLNGCNFERKNQQGNKSVLQSYLQKE